MGYVHCVSRIEHLARRYWFDLLIALLAIVAILNVVLGRGSSGAPTTTLWFCLPALAILVLPVFARRWFPFAGPAVYWLLAAGISFVDPLLIPYPEALFLIGLVAAFLLGNLRDVRRAGLGLAIVVGATATLVYNIPGHSVDQLVFIPLDFAVAWVAGLAVRGGPSRPKWRSHMRHRPSRSWTQRRASPWPRSGRGSRASCTTSSRTP